jgi:putative CocE/NonD family hydrolase
VIHAAGHLLEEFADPFTDTRPLDEEEVAVGKEEFYTFFDSYLRGNAPPLEREVRYFTLGVNRWQTSPVWPPEGLEERRLLLAGDGTLSEGNGSPSGNDDYRVDFAATTGENNRWMTQMGRRVQYPDRRDEDLKLLTYTSAPLASDLEVTGSPTAIIHLSSTHRDGALHLYLEDVGPDGRVTYLTEGMLRLIHRDTADPAGAPYVPLGAYRTFTRADAREMVPGEVEEVRLTLFPISTVFRQGHRIRLAIAGHDASLIDRHPAEGDPVLTVHRGRAHPSQLLLPARAADFPSER